MRDQDGAPDVGQSFRPEQGFFADPALDRIMGVTMALAAEVFVLRSRIRDLEAALDRVGIAIPDDTTGGATADADAFVAHLFAATLGEQQARGPL